MNTVAVRAVGISGCGGLFQPPLSVKLLEQGANGFSAPVLCAHSGVSESQGREGVKGALGRPASELGWSWSWVPVGLGSRPAFVQGSLELAARRARGRRIQGRLC